MSEDVINDGGIWQTLDKIVCIEFNGRDFELVLFIVSDGVLKFVDMVEKASEDSVRRYLLEEGYQPTAKKIEMITRGAHIPIKPVEEGDQMSKVTPGQVWQNGKVVVSVQKEADLLNLIQFEIMGRGLKFTSAKQFDNAGKASRYIKSLKCALTDKVLAAADESLSVI